MSDQVTYLSMGLEISVKTYKHVYRFAKQGTKGEYSVGFLVPDTRRKKIVVAIGASGFAVRAADEEIYTTDDIQALAGCTLSPEMRQAMINDVQNTLRMKFSSPKLGYAAVAAGVALLAAAAFLPVWSVPTPSVLGNPPYIEQSRAAMPDISPAIPGQIGSANTHTPNTVIGQTDSGVRASLPTTNRIQIGRFPETGAIQPPATAQPSQNARATQLPFADLPDSIEDLLRSGVGPRIAEPGAFGLQD